MKLSNLAGIIAIAFSLFVLGAAISEIGKAMHDLNKLESDYADV